jgi:hypothetical protein
LLEDFTRCRTIDLIGRIVLHSTTVNALSLVRREVLLLGKLGIFEPHDGNFLSMIELKKAQSIYICSCEISTG